MSYAPPEDEYDLYLRDVTEAEREQQHIERVIEGVISGRYFDARDQTRRTWEEIQRRLAR